ncbi:MAG: hypothetical protein KAI95_12690, partial [Bacteroidales bacterium]|nr:hypothetical protein [Bacteroidales bacterium]
MMLICLNPISGQNARVYGELFNTQSGLSQADVTTVLQDSLGFLWIGTKDGLNKYDGYSFEHFRYQPDTISLSDNYIHCIAEGRNGILWIGTNYGLNKLDRLRGYLWSYFYPVSRDTLLPGLPVVHSVLEDESGVVWVRTPKRLERLNPLTGEFTGYDLEFSSLPTPADDDPYTMVRDREGNIWMGTPYGLQVFNPKSGQMKSHLLPGRVGLKSSKVRAVLMDHNEQFWIGTGKGLYHFDKDSASFTDMAESLPSLKGLNVFSLTLNSEGLLVVGSDGDLHLIDPVSNEARHFNSYSTQDLTTRLTTIRSIFEDASEILWLATSEGLVKIDQKTRKFDVVSQMNPAIQNLSSYMISSIYKEENGNLWLGTNGSGLNYIETGSESAVVYSRNATRASRRIIHDHIYAIHKDRRGNLWLGTGNGVNVKAAGRTYFSRFCSREPLVPCDLFDGQQVYDITSDSKGQIWFAASNGVHRFNPADGKLRSFHNVFNGREMLRLQ